MKKIVILISGRGSNMQAIIRSTQTGILKNVCTIQSVFSNKPDAAGLQKAVKSGIPTHVIASKGKNRKNYNIILLDWLRKENTDFIILAGYMKILSAEIICEFPKRIINIHPADTSQHQGLHGYDWAFENKLKTTKITVHYVDEGLDTGKIIGQKAVDLSGVRKLEEVEKRGLKVEHEFYSECLNKIFTAKNGKTQSKEKKLNIQYRTRNIQG